MALRGEALRGKTLRGGVLGIKGCKPSGGRGCIDTSLKFTITDQETGHGHWTEDSPLQNMKQDMGMLMRVTIAHHETRL